MPTLTFYRQVRRDGGVRTGVEIDDETLLGLFEGESEEPDPVLSWWVVMECSGEPFPDRPEPSRQWLLDHADVFRNALLALGGVLDAGLDIESWPYRPAPMVTVIEGEEILITTTCAISRRYAGQRLPVLLRDIAEHWGEILHSLHAGYEATL